MNSIVPRHLDYFTFFAIMNKAAINIPVQVFLWTFVAIPFA